VLKWMNDNLDWAQTLGAAFAMQPSDVMKSIQQQRARARAAGTLVNTPQQQVDIEGDDIRIVPANPNMIYAPEYDADEVYEEPEGDAGPLISFGVGYPVGPWLGFECDWDDFGIWNGPWHPGWAYRRDWADARSGGRRWHPDADRGHDLVRNYYRPTMTAAAPRPIAGARPRPEPVRSVAAPRQAVQAAARPAPAERSTPDYRGYGAPAPRTPAPAPQGSLYGGYSRGTQTRDYSSRGQTSRQAPVKAPARAAAPARTQAAQPAARSSAPEPAGKDRR